MHFKTARIRKQVFLMLAILSAVDKAHDVAILHFFSPFAVTSEHISLNARLYGALNAASIIQIRSDVTAQRQMNRVQTVTSHNTDYIASCKEHKFAHICQRPAFALKCACTLLTESNKTLTQAKISPWNQLTIRKVNTTKRVNSSCVF